MDIQVLFYIFLILIFFYFFISSFANGFYPLHLLFKHQLVDPHFNSFFSFPSPSINTNSTHPTKCPSISFVCQFSLSIPLLLIIQIKCHFTQSFHWILYFAKGFFLYPFYICGSPHYLFSGF
jgi:hypothetical protein